MSKPGALVCATSKARAPAASNQTPCRVSGRCSDSNRSIMAKNSPVGSAEIKDPAIVPIDEANICSCARNSPRRFCSLKWPSLMAGLSKYRCSKRNARLACNCSSLPLSTLTNIGSSTSRSVICRLSSAKTLGSLPSITTRISRETRLSRS